jgi:hypothetical protein
MVIKKNKEVVKKEASKKSLKNPKKSCGCCSCSKPAKEKKSK